MIHRTREIYIRSIFNDLKIDGMFYFKIYIIVYPNVKPKFSKIIFFLKLTSQEIWFAKEHKIQFHRLISNVRLCFDKNFESNWFFERHFI